MHEIRLVIAVLLLLFAILIVVEHWRLVIVGLINYRTGVKQNHSLLPLFSLAFSALAYFIYPNEPKGWIWIIPCLDIGNWMLAWALPVLLFYFLRERRKTSELRKRQKEAEMSSANRTEE